MHSAADLFMCMSLDKTNTSTVGYLQQQPQLHSPSVGLCSHQEPAACRRASEDHNGPAAD